jgi:hypothetical protein
MKLLLALFLIIIRIFVGFKILVWLFQESRYPELHSISEIEFYLVILILDTCVAISHAGIDVSVKKEDN